MRPLAITMMPATLDVPNDAVDVERPVANPPATMTLSTLLAGFMKSDQLFTYRGGGAGVEYISGMAAMLVQHPQGDILIDSGFGRDVEEQFLSTPKLMQLLSKVEAETPVADQLLAQRYDPQQLKAVYITHEHWDHVSGLPDLAGVPVMRTAAAQEFIESGDEAAHVAANFENVTYTNYGFTSGPYETFSESHDVYGDGAVVVVPMAGHTPGSVGVFINLPSGKRYLLIGDLTWAKEGVDLPAERPWLARRMVDVDAEAVRQMIVKVHQLKKLRPELIVVPAHDRRMHEQMANYPAVEN